MTEYTNNFGEIFKQRFILIDDIDRWYQIQDLLKDDFVDIYKLEPAQTVTKWLNNMEDENKILKAFLKSKGYDVNEILTFGKELSKDD